MTTNPKQTAAQSLELQLKSARKYGTKSPSALNALVARNILHEELGYFEDPAQRDYQLDQSVRDRLIAHGRQDAAHALLNSITLLEEITRLRRLLWALLVLVASAILILALRYR